MLFVIVKENIYTKNEGSQVLLTKICVHRSIDHDSVKVKVFDSCSKLRFSIKPRKSDLYLEFIF